MIQFPNCKINLGLNIVARRSDGFHDLETVFYPVPLNDILEIIPASDGVFQFYTSGLSIPGMTENNLCVKAFRLLEADFKVPAIKMHLHKVIPMGSGLGGGSSDGAFTLKMLNDLFELDLGREQLKHYASRLGSDCAFFLENRPLFACGRGDRFDVIDADLSGYFLAIVIPDVHVTTAEAYGMVVPDVPDRSIKKIIRLPVEEWEGRLLNDFEKTVCVKHPVIGEIKTNLYKSGAIYAAMSGSGSAVFGIFNKLPVRSTYRDCFFWIKRL